MFHVLDSSQGIIEQSKTHLHILDRRLYRDGEEKEVESRWKASGQEVDRRETGGKQEGDRRWSGEGS